MVFEKSIQSMRRFLAHHLGKRGAADKILRREVLQLFNVDPKTCVDDLSEPLRTYVRYALTTEERAETMLAELLPHISLDGARYLDAGCAYGGSLVAAARAGAKEVMGIELDERLVRIAQAYLAATRVPGRAIQGDVTDPDLAQELGRFDLITCNDVLEHVPDIETSLLNLTTLLKPGGAFYAAIPNRQSPYWIQQDPHFQFFGIVLLDRPEAIQYYTQKTGSDKEQYDVGDYYPWLTFDRVFRNLGLEPKLLNPEPENLAWTLSKIEQDMSDVAQQGRLFVDPQLSSDLVTEVRSRVALMTERFQGAMEAHQALRSDISPSRVRADGLEIVRDFYWPMWHVLCRKS